MSTDEPRVITQEARCGVQLSRTLFPIDLRELRRVLAKNGYELSRMGRIPPPPTQVSFGGDIARKAEITVIAESTSGEIGVIGRSLKEVEGSFKELVSIIDSEIGVSLYDNVRFYWYTVHYKVDTGKPPHKEIDKTGNKKYMKKFDQILGQDLSLFAVRLIPKDAIANQDSWFDIAIEPDIINEKFYHVGIVFRNPDRSTTETFVKDLENKVLKLISIIEA